MKTGRYLVSSRSKIKEGVENDGLRNDNKNDS